MAGWCWNNPLLEWPRWDIHPIQLSLLWSITFWWMAPMENWDNLLNCYQESKSESSVMCRRDLLLRNNPERKPLPSNSSIPTVYEMYRRASAHGEGHGTAALWPRWLQSDSKDFICIHCIPKNHWVIGCSCRAGGLCTFSSLFKNNSSAAAAKGDWSMLGRGPRLCSPQESFSRWESKSDAYIFFKENHKKIAFSLLCTLLCFLKDSKGAGRAKCNKAGYGQQREKLLLLFLPGAGPASTSCSQPQLPAAFWWQKCIMDLPLDPRSSSQAGAKALAQGVWFGAPSHTLPGLACPPFPAEPYWDSASFLQNKGSILCQEVRG